MAKTKGDVTRYYCDECREPLVVTGTQGVCVHGHGRIRPNLKMSVSRRVRRMWFGRTCEVTYDPRRHVRLTSRHLERLTRRPTDMLAGILMGESGWPELPRGMLIVKSNGKEPLAILVRTASSEERARYDDLQKRKSELAKKRREEKKRAKQQAEATKA